MKVAYVDTSCLVAVAFDEPGGEEVGRRIESFEELYSANLLEAEMRAVCAREGVAFDSALLGWIAWVLPDRMLSGEMARVLSAGYVRGADLWHLACALYLADSPRDITFLTLDTRQGEVAGRLGFGV